MAVNFKLWHAEMETPVPEADRMHRSTDPQQMGGYWRLEAARTKVDYPVMIWTADPAKNPSGATIFQIGNKIRNTVDNADEWTEFAASSWLWCRAVSRADYASAMERGAWPDGKPARQMTAEEKMGIDTASGGNNPPVEESLADQIAALVGTIEATKVTDQATADRATGHLDKMRKLLKLAEAEQKKEKQPFLDGGAEVDSRWSRVRDPGINAGALLKVERDRWLKAEQTRLDKITADANRKAREEADKREADERERLRKESQQAGQEIDEKEIAQRAAESVPAPVEIAAPKAKASSEFGRGVSAKKTRKAVVTDAKVMIEHLISTNDTDLSEYLTVRANKAMRAKITLPGVEIVEE